MLHETWGTKSSKITQSFVATLSSLCGCLGSCQPSNGYPAHIAHKIIVNLDKNMDMIRYFCRWLQSRGRQDEALVIMGQCVITTYCTARSGISFIISISIEYFWVLRGKKMKKRKIKRRVHESGKVVEEMPWRRKRGWSLPEWWAWNIVKTYFCKEGNRWGLSSMLSTNSNL